MTNNDEERTLNPPTDTSLPFFAYGIFKPGQLAYSKIKNSVESIDEAEINYEMMIRDGVPIMIDRQSDYHHTQGTIIDFRQGQEQRAYAIISKTLLKALYEWKTISIKGIDVNILFGVNPRNGSNMIEDPGQRVCFDGKNDPLFRDAVEMIGRNLRNRKFSHRMDDFFELQMNYMLLWSAIDRYSSLKYNRRMEKWNREKFANEKAFKRAIRKLEDEHHYPVYSTDDLRIHEFNVDDPYETLNYYYTFRCNVVHRGKAMISDYSMLEKATEELLMIFKEVLTATFGEMWWDDDLKY